MTGRAARLWRGEVPAARVFWEYAAGWGTLLNLVMSGFALVAFVKDMPALGLLLHFSTLPYNALMVLSIFRTTANPSAEHVAFFRAGILLWFVLMLAL